MKDAFGRELNVGDRVVFVTCSYKNEFRFLDIGNIEKICDCMVWINNTEKKYYQRCKKYENRWENRYANRTLRNPNRIVKI